MLEMRELTLETLGEIKGGIVARMFAQAMNRLAADLRAAPELPDWRKVVITIRAKPTLEDGNLGDVITEFEVSGKVPARVTSARMEVKGATNGAKQLFFNMDSPDVPEQHTMFPNSKKADD